MNIELIRLLLDFGLMILIWVLQLVIYPSLCYYKNEDLGRWHKIYTGRIGLIVGPLMIAQLLVAFWQLWKQPNFYTLGSMLVIGIIWAMTFLIFVPLHNSSSPDRSCEKITRSLEVKNWWRTFLWSFLFIGSLIPKISDYNF